MNNPLTEQQLSDLGFTIYHKKRKGQKVFDSCEYQNYCFHAPPGLSDIIRAAENYGAAKYKEKITNKLFD